MGLLGPPLSRASCVFDKANLRTSQAGKKQRGRAVTAWCSLLWLTELPKPRSHSPESPPQIQVLPGKGQELEVSPLQPKPLPQPSHS